MVYLLLPWVAYSLQLLAACKYSKHSHAPLNPTLNPLPTFPPQPYPKPFATLPALPPTAAPNPILNPVTPFPALPPGRGAAEAPAAGALLGL